MFRLRCNFIKVLIIKVKLTFVSFFFIFFFYIGDANNLNQVAYVKNYKTSCTGSSGEGKGYF